MAKSSTLHWAVLASMLAFPLHAQEKSGPMQSGTHTGPPAAAAGVPAAQTGASAEEFDVDKLFAGTCGWCHSKGGREVGKGPRLMNSESSDEALASRIRNGKTGQMPAFGSAFSETQIHAIITYIRDLRPEN
jgi:mono/diheme cytochrome c family protein